jgi:hypothetical protein
MVLLYRGREVYNLDVACPADKAYTEAAQKSLFSL